MKKADQFQINRESVNKCCWNVVFSSLGDLGIVQGHLAVVRAKKILIYHVAATMTLLCSSARPLRLEMYRCISDLVPTGVVMKS